MLLLPPPPPFPVPSFLLPSCMHAMQIRRTRGHQLPPPSHGPGRAARAGASTSYPSLPYLSSNTYAYVHKTLLGTYIWVGLGLYGAVLTQGTNCEPIIFHSQKFTRLQVPPPSPPRPRTSQGDRNPQGASDDDSANIPDSRGISSSCRFQSQFRVFVFPF